jgi:hypothetical protein
VSAATIFLFLLVGCPKSETVADAGPAASVAPSASQVTLAPLGETAVTATPTTTPTVLPPLQTTTTETTPKPLPTTTATAATSATPHTAGAQAQVRQCCAALRRQSQRPSEQQPQLAQAAAACDALVAAMGGAVPQLAQIKMLLQGATLPPVCQGL